MLAWLKRRFTRAIAVLDSMQNMQAGDEITLIAQTRQIERQRRAIHRRAEELREASGEYEGTG